VASAFVNSNEIPPTVKAKRVRKTLKEMREKENANEESEDENEPIRFVNNTKFELFNGGYFASVN